MKDEDRNKSTDELIEEIRAALGESSQKKNVWISIMLIIGIIIIALGGYAMRYKINDIRTPDAPTWTKFF